MPPSTPARTFPLKTLAAGLIVAVVFVGGLLALEQGRRDEPFAAAGSTGQYPTVGTARAARTRLVDAVGVDRDELTWVVEAADPPPVPPAGPARPPESAVSVAQTASGVALDPGATPLSPVPQHAQDTPGARPALAALPPQTAGAASSTPEPERSLPVGTTSERGFADAPPRPAPIEASTTPTNAPPPRAQRTVQPRYPAQARRQGISGTVELGFVILADGSVAEVTVLSATPPGTFEREAVEAMQRWRFEPSDRVRPSTHRFEFRTGPG